MIIGIDGNEANVEKKVGISEYGFELLRQFKEFPISNFQFPIKFVVYLKSEPRPEMPKESENWRYRIVKPAKFWTRIGLPFDLFVHQPQPDVFFSPSHYGPLFAPMPTAISIMDVSYVHFPHLFAKKDLYQLNNWTRSSAKRANKIFTISSSSKNDILKEYEVSPEKVVVTHLGIKQLETNSSMDILEKKYNLSKKYILFVGTLQPRKNIVRLIEAFAKVVNKNEFSEYQLVIVGKKGWLYEEIIDSPKKNKVEDKVKFLEFVENDDLGVLYKNATCFVLPSLYEGFGLPVLEAMQYGCPVITSNVSSLPEAGGDAALYINPEDVNDIARKIEKLLSDKKLREELIEKGKKHVKSFSWEKTAEVTLQELIKLGEK